MADKNSIKNSTKQLALGGILVALAVVIMCLGGLIPLSTFVCPILCMLILQVVIKQCGKRLGWAWYGAVAILSVLIGPDKEAAALFVFLGYYPLIKPWLDGLPIKWLWKILYFNAIVLVMYRLLICVLGMDGLEEEFREMGSVLQAVTLLLGNFTFVLLDKILEKRFRRR